MKDKYVTKIKLWISDIDGTLINYDGSYTKEITELITKMQQKGIKVVLATGRMFMGAQFAADNFNIDTPVVCYQGAVVRNKKEVLWQAPVQNNLAKEIIQYLKLNKIHTHIYNDDILYIEDDNKKIMDQYCNGRGTTYTLLNSFDDITLTNVAKILAVIEDNSLMQKVKNELKEKYKNKLTIVQSSPIYLEINDIKATKGEALNFLKQYWNLKNDEIIASGDQDNDIDMLKNAGIKIAVGNNSEQLQQIADYKAKDVNSNELVKIIERLVF